MAFRPWQSTVMPMEAQRPLAVWQCCTRAAQWWIPIGATWVDYIPEVNVMIETNARQGIWQFDILFPTNDTVYNSISFR